MKLMKKEKRVIVNWDNVCRVKERTDEGCDIYFTDGSVSSVRETFEQISEKVAAIVVGD